MVPAVILALLAPAGDAPPSPAATAALQLVPFKSKVETWTADYRSQLLESLDRPVGDGLELAGTRFPARITDKGVLELDLKRDGKFASVAAGKPVAVQLERGGEDPKKKKATCKLTLIFAKGGDGAWRYRNVTQLSLQVGSDLLAVVDANGNGIYGEPGEDGMCWLGQRWLWPVPPADEGWCTPKLELSGLSMGPWGEDAKALVRPLATTVPEALGVLQDINRERVKLGLTPRPEDPALAAPLQKHCHYMLLAGQLGHPEEAGKPGFSPEGHEAGMNSILGVGTPADRLAQGMVATFYHRQDVIRPLTLGFGVGYDGKYGGIDGRRRQGGGSVAWPVLCPVPDQEDVPERFASEVPDPINGDREAGFPITAYFGSEKLRLVKYELKHAGAKGPTSIGCYTFDADTGGKPDFNRFQKVIALIPKEPLEQGQYRVAIEATVDGQPWSRTWDFTVGQAAKRK